MPHQRILSKEEIQKFAEEYILPSGLTVKEAEEQSQNNVEAIFIETFAKGFPIYYKDERCTEKRHLIRAMPDGSEDLIDFEWETEKETLIKQLLPPGDGKFAHLLNDPRYLKQAKK